MKKILSFIKSGELVSFPTDTVYALACDANNCSAIDKIYEIKKRDISKPLSVFFKDIEQAKEYLIFNKKAEILAKRFMPGELTIILNRKDGVLNYLNKGNRTIGFRIPKSDFCMKILKEISPIVATSVNISGKSPALNSDEVKKYFDKKISYIVKNNENASNKSSTVIDLSEDNIKYLREGTLSFNLIRRFFDENNNF